MNYIFQQNNNEYFYCSVPVQSIFEGLGDGCEVVAMSTDSKYVAVISSDTPQVVNQSIALTYSTDNVYTTLAFKGNIIILLQCLCKYNSYGEEFCRITA